MTYYPASKDIQELLKKNEKMLELKNEIFTTLTYDGDYLLKGLTNMYKEQKPISLTYFKGTDLIYIDENEPAQFINLYMEEVMHTLSIFDSSYIKRKDIQKDLSDKLFGSTYHEKKEFIKGNISIEDFLEVLDIDLDIIMSAKE